MNNINIQGTVRVLTKFASRKLLLVLIPVGLAIAKGILCESGEILDGKVIGLVAFYIVVNVVQKVFIIWLKLKHGSEV